MCDEPGRSTVLAGLIDLIETRPFGSRVIYERYRRIRDDSE